MIFEGLINLASYGGFGGGAIGNLLAQWEAAGIFSYVLPFLLIFALVFTILSFVPLFQNNKGINAVISLVTALMALQFGIVSIFFSEIFPRLGIGLSIVLVLIILMGLLVRDEEKGNQMIKWMLIIAIIVIAIVVISNSLSSFGYAGFGGGQFWNFLRYNWGTILGVALFVGLVIAIIAGQNPKPKMKNVPVGLSPLIGR
jgi:hypothetical protein